VLTLISKAVIRSRKFYDLTFTIDVRLNAEGSFGLIFRQVDFFNYYAIVVDKKSMQIIKITDGSSEVLTGNLFKEQIQENMWYNMKLTIKKDKFQVFFVREIDAKDPERYKNMPLENSLEARDQLFKSGHFGVFVDYMSRIMFDNFVVTPLPCEVEPVEK